MTNKSFGETDILETKVNKIRKGNICESDDCFDHQVMCETDFAPETGRDRCD